MVGFPLLLIPLAVCNIIIFLMPGVSLTATLASIPLMSGVAWAFTLSDVLIAVGILLLLLEVAKGARPGAKYLTDHLLSFIVFGAAVAEFVLLPQFGNSTFFMLTLLAGVEFLSSITLRVRRSPRAVAVPLAPVPTSTTTVRTEPEVVTPAAPTIVTPAPVAPTTVAPAAVEPAPVAPTPPIPTAAPVAESVLSEPPVPVTPPAIPADHAPVVAKDHLPSEIPSPGLQPSEGVHLPPNEPRNR